MACLTAVRSIGEVIVVAATDNGRTARAGRAGTAMLGAAIGTAPVAEGKTRAIGIGSEIFVAPSRAAMPLRTSLRATLPRRMSRRTTCRTSLCLVSSTVFFAVLAVFFADLADLAAWAVFSAVVFWCALAEWLASETAAEASPTTNADSAKTATTITSRATVTGNDLLP